MNKKYKIEDKETKNIKITAMTESEVIVDLSSLERSIIGCDAKIKALKDEIDRVRSLKTEAKIDLVEAKKLLK